MISGTIGRSGGVYCIESEVRVFVETSVIFSKNERVKSSVLPPLNIKKSTSWQKLFKRPFTEKNHNNAGVLHILIFSRRFSTITKKFDYFSISVFYDWTFHPKYDVPFYTKFYIFDTRIHQAFRTPGLTITVKYDDHDMTWYGHGDSCSPWYDHDKVMAWSLCNVVWSWYDRHRR